MCGVPTVMHSVQRVTRQNVTALPLAVRGITAVRMDPLMKCMELLAYRSQVMHQVPK